MYHLQGVRVEVEIGGLQSWLDSAELDAVLAPLSLASSKKLSTEELVQDDMIAEERCRKAFQAVQVYAHSRAKYAWRQWHAAMRSKNEIFTDHQRSRTQNFQTFMHVPT